jgi:glycosidase
LRFLENHDNKRASDIIPEINSLKNWTAFMYLLKGTALIYAGQEVCCSHTPSLFDKDPVNWSSKPDISTLFQKLYKIKQSKLLSYGVFAISYSDEDDIVTIKYERDDNWLEASFTLKEKHGEIHTVAADGEYINLLDDTAINVKGSKYKILDDPIVITSDSFVINSLRKA